MKLKVKEHALIISCYLIASFQLFAQDSHGISIKEINIPMSDGIMLAADLYLPDEMPQGKTYPILLEYLPYRKTEGRAMRFPLYSYFIRQGYIIARVDIRGTGNSEGKLIEYEYTEQEQRDGEEVIAWLASQSFCSGNIGMFGISWGGFNSIHLAMRKPPALKAIVAMMATDDIYQDDVHFIDGMMHVDAYEIGQDLTNVLPGAPDFVIDENYFKNRFDTYPWLLRYKKQQRDGSFWDRASLNKNYESLTIPTFVIGGWYDGYRDSVPRMLRKVKAPMKAIIGPWNHTFPNHADPPPSIEWRHEAVRWFDYWLQGIENGIMSEPRFAVYVRDGHAPGSDLKEITGSWRWEDGWPIDNSVNQTYFLHDDHSLQLDPQKDSKINSLKLQPSAGHETGGSVMWWGDWAPDQRPADSISLVYETEPLKEPIIILGFPTATLNTTASSSQANWFVRLNDVAPDGSVTQVTGAGFNGTHRNSAEHPEKIKVGEFFDANIEMHFTSWTFQEGHRIRLSINNSQWPMIWPSPSPLTTSLTVGGIKGSTFQLPILGKGSLGQPNFLPPVEDPSLQGYSSLALGTNSGFAEVAGVNYDILTQQVTLTATNQGADQFPWGTVSYAEKIIHSTNNNAPANSSVESKYSITANLTRRVLTWEGLLALRSDRNYFYYQYTRRLFENQRLIREKKWNEKIKRDFQ